MFPIDIAAKDWNRRMLAQFDELIAPKRLPWKLEELFPKVLLAGDQAGVLTEEGVKRLDTAGTLKAGILACPPEGDAETFGMEVDRDKLFETLYNKALEGDDDCGGLLAYNYFSGEPVTGFEEGRPLFVRTPDSKFNLANFMRVNLYASLGTFKAGMDILLKEECVALDEIMGHGGFFKTKGVGQRILAAALNVPVTVMDTAGEGGAWGIALLASYMINKAEGETLDVYLAEKIFADQAGCRLGPKRKEAAGFEAFSRRYLAGFPI